MRKILLAAMLLCSFAVNVDAQYAGVQIINNRDWNIQVTLYGQFTTTCGGLTTCGIIHTSVPISVGYLSSVNFPDISLVYNYETSVFGSILGACPSVTYSPYRSFLTTTSSDFQWTYAVVQIMDGCTLPVTVGDIGVGCTLSSSVTTTGCPASFIVSWAPSIGTAMSDITITVN
jgi:hypothetical protein